MRSYEEYSLQKYNNIVENINIDQEYKTYLNNIKILMRQTIYSEEECSEKLIHKSLNECILEYMGKKPTDQIPSTTNQNIYKAIRTFF
jgi:hypothetical protein